MSVFEQARSQSKISKDELIKVGDRTHYIEIHKNITRLSEVLTDKDIYSYYEMGRVDQVKRSYEICAKIIALKSEDTYDRDMPHSLDFLPNVEIPGTVSHLMVRPIISVLGNDEQRAKWLPLLDTTRIIGAYAQTELGHGSDVQSLETEAAFDEKSGNFILNSPTISSTKWWPGELGHLSNIAVVFAKVLLKGKKIGVFPIVVQLRDFESHKVLEGIEVGDIGPKFGYFSKENGFLRFKNVKVPREHLLSRFFEVSPEGEFQLNGNPKIIYSSMMKVRTFLLLSSSAGLGKAVAIALRYSNLRRQFRDERKNEIPVINYQLQQYKLFPLLAKSYAMQYSFLRLRDKVNELNEEVKNDNFKNLQECHILLCGAKALATWWCYNGLYVAMQCCGGHGYSHYSGIPTIIQNLAPNTILEGENTMLCTQVGKHLIKNFRAVREGKPDKARGSCVYFKDLESKLKEPAFGPPTTGFMNEKDYVELFQRGVLTSCNIIHDNVYASGSENEQSMYIMMNKKEAVRLYEASKLHIVLFMFDFFIQTIQATEHAGTKTALTNLALLFINDALLENVQLLFSVGVMKPEVVKRAEEQREALLEALRPEALVLAESYLAGEAYTMSAIADVNEKPYENLYNIAKKFGALNNVDLSGHYLQTIRKASLETYPEVIKPKI